MARPKELTDADKFFLQNHINNDAGELAKAIRNTTPVVQAYLDEVKAGTIRTVPFEDVVIKKVRNNVVVATVMTEGASQIADASRNTTPRPNNPDFIHSCKPNRK
jgi:hypothetical protein